MPKFILEIEKEDKNTVKVQIYRPYDGKNDFWATGKSFEFNPYGGTGKDIRNWILGTICDSIDFEKIVLKELKRKHIKLCKPRKDED
jgi:hypothetical protein